MKETKAEKERHTPGPWRVVPYAGDDDTSDEFAEIRANCDEHPNCHKTIAFGRGWNQPLVCSNGPTTKANARLIAAAPDLLAALKELVNRLNDDLDDDQCAAWDAGRAAIQKAEG